MLNEVSPILYDSTSSQRVNYASSSNSSSSEELEIREHNPEDNTFPKLSKFHSDLPDITLRGIVLGLLIGSVLSFTNLYFGLQTGWISMMSLQASLIAFSLGRSLVLNNPNKTSEDSEIGRNRKREYKWYNWGTPFGIKENVFIQTCAVATATMPLAGGFVGIIPALNLLTPEETAEYGGTQGIKLTTFKLIIWGLGIAFFGVIFAIPLRKQVIIKEKLKFPSGTATAQMIRVLHEDNNDKNSSSGSQQVQQRQEESSKAKQQREETKIHWDTLLSTFGISSAVTVLANIFPILNVIPIFNFIVPSASQWGWFLSPTLSYVGQGIIMGVPTTLSMLLGAFVGWGILGPIAKSSGWADGPINDWKTGAKGWILWISLGVMISESLINLGILTYKEVNNFVVKSKLLGYREVNKDLSSDENDNTENEEPIIPNWLLMTGLALSFLLCLVSIKYLFHNIPLSSILISILLGCLLSILAVRSLGETDLNPVSGIGKVSQIVFGGLLPGNIVANLVAGGIAEAGAQQAGDMMQDLQTGHLLHSSPRAQFIGQLLGSFVSVFISVFAYQLYNQVYTIPGPEFPVPTAQVWLDMARLVNGEPLPKNSLPFTIIFSLIFTLFPIIQEFWPNYTPLHYLPNGIAFAVGIYNPPNFTLPRVLGAVVSDLYLKGYFTKFWAYIKHKTGKQDTMCEFRSESGENEMECLNPEHCHTKKGEHRSPSFYRVWCTVIASGLVLGEGTMALVVLIVKAMF